MSCLFGWGDEGFELNGFEVTEGGMFAIVVVVANVFLQASFEVIDVPEGMCRDNEESMSRGI